MPAEGGITAEMQNRKTMYSPQHPPNAISAFQSIGLIVPLCRSVNTQVASLRIKSLENPPILLVTRERDTQFKQPHNNIREILKEEIVVIGILLHPRLKFLVLDERHVGWQHHQTLGALILILCGPVPFAPCPLLIEEKLKVVVGQDGWRKGPWAVVAGAICVTSAQCMGTAQGDDLLVVPAHATEDGPQMVRAL